MKLRAPFIQLPIIFDAGLLAEEISRIEPGAWRAHPDGTPGNSALALIARDGDPSDDKVSGPMRPTPWLEKLPYLMQVLDALGATWGRSRLMRLSGQSEVTPHVDINYYWRERMRVHVPVITTPSVRIHCGDSDVHMAAGECWIFDTWRLHRVMNAGNEERIHLVADTVGGERFWDLADAGRVLGDNKSNWQPQALSTKPDAEVALDFETVNVPVVMTPWEIQRHLSFLIGEAKPSPALDSILQLLWIFARRWQALWSCYGEDRDGWLRYRKLIDTTRTELTARAAGVLLKNEVTMLRAVSSHILDVALADRNTSGDIARLDRHGAMPESGAKPSTNNNGAIDKKAFDQPVFIVSSPRSGSTLLFETLAEAPGIYTIGEESHKMIEQVQGLSPRDRSFDSNALGAVDATPERAHELREHFYDALRDRDNQRPQAGAVRMLEKTPKNALRISFLNEVFPGGRFVFLYRDARETIASMMDAWQSGRFRTYPGLPEWPQLPWSLVLVPGWRELASKPLHEIVATQWETTMNCLMDGLDALPRERWCAIDYAALLKQPQAQMKSLCQELGLAWDRELGESMPLSRYTLTKPATDKWRKHAAVIEPMLPSLAPTIERARAVLAEGLIPPRSGG